jgi:hypothetical protein
MCRWVMCCVIVNVYKCVNQGWIHLFPLIIVTINKSGGLATCREGRPDVQPGDAADALQRPLLNHDLGLRVWDQGLKTEG